MTMEEVYESIRTELQYLEPEAYSSIIIVLYAKLCFAPLFNFDDTRRD